MKKLKIYFFLIILILISACSGLNEKQRKSVEDAISALRKIDAATDVGINKPEYSKMVIDAKAAVNNASEILPDGELKQSLQETIQNYEDADKIWFIGGTDTFVPVCLADPVIDGKDELQAELIKVFCNPTGGEIAKKYSLPLRKPSTLEPAEGAGAVIKKEALTIIWQKAKENLKKASDLYNKS
jgi:hypothetical protein